MTLLPAAWSALGGDAGALGLVAVGPDGRERAGPGPSGSRVAGSAGASAGTVPGAAREAAGSHAGAATADPALLPSRWPALDASVAAVAASTLAAAVLDAARSGRGPAPVTVDPAHVAVAVRSERYAHRLGAAAADSLFAPLSRFWRTADGWLRLHANYPWHRDAALRVLDCADDPAAVEKAVAGWRGAELEDALAAAGGVGYAVRTPAEWAAHPQGRTAAPLVAWAGPAAVPPSTGRYAAGVRVLDLTRVIAGPVATRTLARWGADVLRVDSPRLPEIEAQALDMLPGKRSTLLDLADRTDRATFEGLLAEADVLVQGYRPGALARYGLAADALAERHPRLAVVTLSAWGTAGPWADRRGFDSLVQCPTGIAAVEGDGDRPGALPAQVLDHGTGYLAAAAALLALAGVGGRSATLSLAATARWLTAGGPVERPAALDVDPDPYQVTLPGPAGRVRVVRPPGAVGDDAPAWTGTTDLGADLPAFRPRPAAGASRQG